MALIPCPSCNHHISDKALACPKCGISKNSRITKSQTEIDFKNNDIRDSDFYETPQEISESELNHTPFPVKE
jgi:hypothetical protein